MTAARELLSSGPGPAVAPAPERGHAQGAADRGPSPVGANRTVARALAGAAASRALGLAEAATKRTLARCPGCGGRCGGTCGQARSEPDEELLASGQRALRRAVLARRGAVSPRF
ncbi:MAG TPA: hypothetical protein VGG07_10115 [Solirubrobacteraceae bacterium]